MNRSRLSSFGQQSISLRTLNLLFTAIVLVALFALSLAKNVAQEAAAENKPATPVAEAKPAETPTTPETKPAEAKPAETPATPETKPAEAKPAVTPATPETKPAEAKPAETPATPETKPAEVKPTETPATLQLAAPQATAPEKKDAAEAKPPVSDEGVMQSFGDVPTAPVTATTSSAAVPATVAAPVEPQSLMDSPLFAWIIFAIILFGSFYAGVVLSKLWRLPDHQFRIFVLLLAFLGSAAACILGWHRLTLGIDLRGGVVLVYDVFPSKKSTQQDHAEAQSAVPAGTIDMDQLTRAITKRINPGGVREIAISKLGNRQLQVIIPEAEASEVARIRKIIAESGALEFRILASTNYPQDQSIIDRALRDTSREIRDSAGNRIAEWIPVDENEKASVLSAPDTVKRERDKHFEVLVLFNDGCDVTGEYLSGVSRGMDESGKPGVSFRFNSIGERKFRQLTTNNRPNSAQPTVLRRQLGIIMNDSLYSAPYINDVIGASGIISFGQRNTDEEIRQLNRDIDDLISVLDAGSLPAELSKEPVSELLIGATLGDDTIKKGNAALIGSAVIVLAFMLVYYRLAGFIACFCVITNLMLIVAVMLALQAAFTLPGLAGLVLTVGMAVDANILIYERLREELKAGASLKMGIRNAYAKAFSAIFDSNITTILTGVILYAVGTEQVKGFAVTLVLGVTFSMFTAIYCARTIMDILEAQRSINTFKMMQLFNRPNINFMGAKYYCLVFSIVLMVISVFAIVARGRGIFDIDFIGGVSVQVDFKDSQKIETIREKLTDLNDLAVQNVRSDLANDAKNAKKNNTSFIITTSIPQDKSKVNIEPDDYRREVQDKLKAAFGDDLVYRKLEYTQDDKESTAEKTVTNLVLDPGMNYESIQSAVRGAMQTAVATAVLPKDFSYSISSPEYFPADTRLHTHWKLTSDAPKETVEKLLAPIKTNIDATPLFPTSTTVGGSVARDTRIKGLVAVVASLICIVFYIWLRFHKLVFGISAVLALVHVVWIVYGLIAISKWLEVPLGFMQIETFKIGLPVVAAFLTIIGYALNDTIILFDRIRENRGKSPRLTEKMINDSINQTLSRTVLTAATTAVVAIVLFFWGGQGIHTFAFAMSAGVIFGTYSTIGLAAPLLLWLGGDDVEKSNPYQDDSSK